jgi:methionyl-tRNA formyltransferase
VFAGTAMFGQPTLNQLREAGHEIALVVTQPDRVAGRGLKLLQSGTKRLALELGLEVFQPERIKDEASQARIRQVDADVMVVVAYGQILPGSLITAPRLGTLNVHASLLPRHRGPAPIEWSILSGDRESGVTIMQMDAGVDTGPILAQARIPIAPDELAPSLEGRLSQLGGQLMVKTLDDLQHGRVRAVPQPSDGVSYAPRLTSDDGKLKPEAMSAQDIDRRVRALSRIGCWIRLGEVDIKVIRGHLGGQVGEGIAVPTTDGVYVVDDVQPPGRRVMSAAAWMRGRR